jgi:hypothetical protein
LQNASTLVGRPASAQNSPSSSSQSSWGSSLADQLAGLRATDGDVAAAKLGGEIREDARLEMAAVQAPGMPAFTDDPLPLLRRERHVEHRPVEVIGDVIADKVRERQGVLDGVQDAAIGACGLKLDDPRECEYGRAVPRRWRARSGM